MTSMDRRTFLKAAGGTVGGGVAALWLGSAVPDWFGAQGAFAQSPGTAAPTTQTLRLRVTDAVKEMATHNAINRAECYFWVYQVLSPEGIATDVPGPSIFLRAGSIVTVVLENALDEPHNFAIPAARFVSPTVPPGKTMRFRFKAPKAGSYLYYDSLNAPVNRMMGLHGALVVMPRRINGTPYGAADLGANPRLTRLFGDLGTTPHFPGLRWDEGGENGEHFPPTPGFRQYIWLLHQASPLLFADVGNAPPGVDFDAALFMDRFLDDPITFPTNPPVVNSAPNENRVPQYFTINGQSGHFVHGSPFMTPHLRVGEPCIIRVLNAGLWTHSMHLHANHIYVLQVNNRSSYQPDILPGQTDNHIWVDTFTARPLDVWDWLLPYQRPPDIPNARGIGLPDPPMTSNAPPIADYGADTSDPTRLRPGPTPAAQRTWPPIQELNMHIPRIGREDGTGRPLHLQLSPMCFPMHDHGEPSQTAQGGNYNMGLIAGMNFIGDRTLGPDVVTFPMSPMEGPTAETGAAAGPEPPFEHHHEGTI